MIWRRRAEHRSGAPSGKPGVVGPPRSRGRRPLAGPAGLLAAGLASLSLACYSFSGGGGLPSHVKTAYVAPVTNETPRFGLSELLNDRLLLAVRQRLGLRLASEAEADAVIRASVRQYTDDEVAFDAQRGVGADVFVRRVTIAVRVEIFDARRNQILWETMAVTGAGEYEPGNETEEVGMEIALENVVQRIVDGAQSQW